MTWEVEGVILFWRNGYLPWNIPHPILLWSLDPLLI